MVTAKDTGRAAALRRARLDAGLSQSALARRSGVDQSAISAYEGGRREMSDVVAAKLASALEIDRDVLLHPPKRVAAKSAYQADDARSEVLGLRVFKTAPEAVKEAFLAREPPADEDYDFFSWVEMLREEWEEYASLTRAQSVIESLSDVIAKGRGDVESMRKTLAEFEGHVQKNLRDRAERRRQGPLNIIGLTEAPELPDSDGITRFRRKPRSA